VAGGENSILTNPTNATRIIDSAIGELNGLRGSLGALVRDVFEPNARSLGVRIENLTASESEVRDADFALEVARAVRNQILTQAGIRVLGQQNQLGRGILDLLK
jgi:flagellin